MLSSGEGLNELKRLQSVVTSLTGVITELQASNTNLAAMIAQQVITNTNLTNSIIELQNQVALQTTTNTNLVAMIAQLTTSVTTLTTITGQLVTVNIRALDNTDLSHEPLPYNQIPINASMNINPGALNGHVFTAALGNWTVGLDYYPTSCAVILTHGTDNFFKRQTYGVSLMIYELETLTYYIRDVMNWRSTPVSLNGGTLTVAMKTYLGFKDRIDTGNTLMVVIKNNTPYILTFGVSVLGMEI